MNRFEQFNAIIDSKLSSGEKLLLLTLHRHYNHDQKCSFPSITQLMEGMSLKNQQSFYKYKKSLEEQGILMTHHVKGKGNRYTIDYNLLTKCNVLTNDTVGHLQNVTTKRKRKEKDLTNNINYESLTYELYDRDYSYFYGGGWMQEELSTEFIC